MLGRPGMPLVVRWGSVKAVITRLADILVIQTIRSWIEQDAVQTGWLRALQDKRLGHALFLIHRNPAHPWTVASLATEVAMSEAAFSRAFKRFVGVAPGGIRRQGDATSHVDKAGRHLL